MLVTSSFSFSHNVFHSYISLVHQIAALCGNGLKVLFPIFTMTKPLLIRFWIFHGSQCIYLCFDGALFTNHYKIFLITEIMLKTVLKTIQSTIVLMMVKWERSHWLQERTLESMDMCNSHRNRTAVMLKMALTLHKTIKFWFKLKAPADNKICVT